MILGMTMYAFVHTLISLVGIVSGIVVVARLLKSDLQNGWTSVFLGSMVLTCMTGFFFPFHGFKPSYVVGVLTMILLAMAMYARYARELAGGWRRTYVVSMVLAFYFNVFVLVFQSFLKIPALRALAPTQSEPPFKWAQLAFLALFVVLGIGADRRFHPQTY
jgi:hypothetical protein